MAQFFGKPSKYLLKNDLKYWLYGLCVVVLLALAMYVIAKKIQLFTTSILGLVFLIILIRILSDLGDIYTNKFKKKSDNFYNGRMGEEEIMDELDFLPDEYLVFRGVIFDDIGDVDFTVVGPTGIFTIDAKDCKRAKVDFDGKELTFNGRRQRKNIFWQAIEESSHIQRLLIDSLHVKYIVEPVLVFSSYVKLHFGLNKVNNQVYVIGRPFLIKLIKNRPVILSPDQIESIVVILRTRISENKLITK